VEEETKRAIQGKEEEAMSYWPTMMGYKRRIMLSRHSTGKLRWCVCVGSRLNHPNCRIYTNQRRGVKVKVHAQTFSQRDLRVPEPWMALESTAKGVKDYREVQIRVAEAMKKIYTPKFSARVRGVTP